LPDTDPKMTPTAPDLTSHSRDSPFLGNWVLSREIHETAESFTASASHK
jgi:hypothetical protein